MSLFHTYSHGPDEAALGRALAQAVTLAKAAGHNTCRIASHTRDSFLMGVFAKVCGHKFAKGVASTSGGTLEGCSFFLATAEIAPSVPQDSPIIASHVSPAWLESLIADKGTAPIIYLPWLQAELEAYEAAHPDSLRV